jgi:hypothetical protein
MSVSLNEIYDLAKQKGVHLQIWGAGGGKSILEYKFIFKNETFIDNLIVRMKATDVFFHFVNNKGHVTINGVRMINSEFEKSK